MLTATRGVGGSVQIVQPIEEVTEIVVELAEDKAGECFTIDTDDGACFSISSTEGKCFTTDKEEGEEELVSDHDPELDLLVYMKIIFGIYFSTADRLFVLGRGYGGTDDEVYMYEFTYQSGVLGGIKEITGLFDSTFLFYSQSDNTNTDFWLRGWGSVFTSQVMIFRFDNKIYFYNPQLKIVTADNSNISVAKTTAFIDHNEVLYAGLDQYDFYANGVADCGGGGIITDQLFYKAWNNLSVLGNTDQVFWAKNGSYFKGQFWDSRGKNIAVSERVFDGTSDDNIVYIMYDTYNDFVIEPTRKIIPSSLSESTNVCSYSVQSATYIELPTPHGSVVATLYYDNRYLGIAIANGSADHTIHFIDLTKIIAGYNPLIDVLVSSVSVTSDVCMCNNFFLEVDGDGRSGLISQNPIQP